LNHEQILKLLERAKNVAIKWGFPQLADDFAQEAFIAISSGAHPKLEWLFITFLRREYGDSRSISGRIRQLAEKFAVRLDAPVSEEDAGAELNHDRIRSSEPDPESRLIDRRVAIPYWRLSGKKAEIVRLALEGGFNYRQIGQLYNVSEAHVGGILLEAKRKLAGFLEYKNLKEEFEMLETKKIILEGIEL
jgi:DNA-directed RNA polymerase specialized sigma24 family protein